jgi:Lipocalin-like domain
VFGTYSINLADKIMTFRLETATFPNWNGTEQKRSLVTFSQDELKYTSASASVGGPATTTWKRAK